MSAPQMHVCATESYCTTRTATHFTLLHSSKSGATWRLVPVFWVIIGRKNTKENERNSYGSPGLCTSCAVRHQPCSPVLSATGSSVVLSSSRKERCCEDGGNQASFPVVLGFSLDCPVSKKVEVLAEPSPSCGSRCNFPW